MAKSPHKKAQEEYWKQFETFITKESSLIQEGALERVRSDGYSMMHQTFSFGFPRSRVAIECLANMNDFRTSKGTPDQRVPAKSLAISLTIQKDFKGLSPVELVARLRRDQAEIEQGIGKLIWPGATVDDRRLILLVNRGENPTDASRRPQQHRWFLEKLEAFQKVFYPRLNNLAG